MNARRALLVLILIMYTALGVYYAVTVPMFEAPDEVAHFFYARHLADARTLPVQNSEKPTLWGAIGSQPPLYYVLLAPIVSAVETPNAHAYLWRNPYVNLQHPLFPGNKNYYIHTDRERWPYQGLPLAVHLARGMSILLGVLTLLLVYRFVRTLAPFSPPLALVVTASVAFLPGFIFVTSTVNNDALYILLATATMWVMVHAVDEIRTGRTIGLGMLVGLAAVTKLSGFVLLAPATLAVWLGARRKQARAWRFVTGLWGGFLMVAGWWYARNVATYGDPLGLTQLVSFARYPFSFDFPTWGHEITWLLRSFWALFGWHNVAIGPRAYLLLLFVLLASVVGLGIASLRRLPALPSGIGWPLLLMVAVLVGAGATARGLGLLPLIPGRIVYPALGGLLLLLLHGWTALVPARVRQAWLIAFPLGLLVLSSAIPSRWIIPAYRPPPRLSPDNIPAGVRRVDFLFDNRIRVWAVDIPQITVHTGDTMDITLYMGKVGELPVDYTLYIRLLGREQEEVGRLETFTGWGTYPTRLWKDGEVIADHYRVRVSPRARVPTLLRVEIGFLNHWTGQALPITTLEGAPVRGLVKSLRLVARQPALPTPTVATRAIFADEIALVGYDPPPPRVKRGETLTFRLYWEALRPARASYTVFTHLVREGDPHPVAQHDKRPLDGDYPTIAWAPGEVVVDEYRIEVPENISPGTYLIVTGLYRLETLQRLPLQDGPTQPWLQNAAIVATVKVE